MQPASLSRPPLPDTDKAPSHASWVRSYCLRDVQSVLFDSCNCSRVQRQRCGHHHATKFCLAGFKVIVHAVPEGKLRMRRKAVIALAAHKQEGLQQLKDDPDEMLRGQATCHPVIMKQYQCSFFLGISQVYKESDLYAAAP